MELKPAAGIQLHQLLTQAATLTDHHFVVELRHRREVVAYDRVTMTPVKVLLAGYSRDKQKLWEAETAVGVIMSGGGGAIVICICAGNSPTSLSVFDERTLERRGDALSLCRRCLRMPERGLRMPLYGLNVRGLLGLLVSTDSEQFPRCSELTVVDVAARQPVIVARVEYEMQEVRKAVGIAVGERQVVCLFNSVGPQGWAFLTHSIVTAKKFVPRIFLTLNKKCPIIQSWALPVFFNFIN